MGLLIALDSGALGIAARAEDDTDGRDLRALLWAHQVGGSPVLIPAIADYEVRRGLIVARATAGLRRLAALKSQFVYRAIRPADLDRAAELWAFLVRRGAMTAHPHNLDADSILAAQALHAGKPGDRIVIATENVRHMGRFPGVEAFEWHRLPPP